MSHDHGHMDVDMEDGCCDGHGDCCNDGGASHDNGHGHGHAEAKGDCCSDGHGDCCGGGHSHGHAEEMGYSQNYEEKTPSSAMPVIIQY